MSMQSISCVVAAMFAMGLSSCTTTPLDTQTPVGYRSADQTGPFVILGVLRRNTSTLNQSSAEKGYSEKFLINVPAGTQMIVPAVQGWGLMYGRIEPPGALSGGTWHPEDHNFGDSAIYVEVIDIDAPDYSVSPPTQTATIEVRAVLRDEWADDSWTGTVNYTLICLGKPVTVVPIERVPECVIRGDCP